MIPAGVTGPQFLPARAGTLPEFSRHPLGPAVPWRALGCGWLARLRREQEGEKGGRRAGVAASAHGHHLGWQLPGRAGLAAPPPPPWHGARPRSESGFSGCQRGRGVRLGCRPWAQLPRLLPRAGQAGLTLSRPCSPVPGTSCGPELQSPAAPGPLHRPRPHPAGSGSLLCPPWLPCTLQPHCQSYLFRRLAPCGAAPRPSTIVPCFVCLIVSLFFSPQNWRSNLGPSH